MPSAWQIFHVSPFLPLCPLPPLSSISVTELPGRRRAAQPPPPPVYEPYTSIYQNPLFSARHGSRSGGRRRDLTSLLSDTRRKREVYYIHTWDGHAQLHVHILLSPLLTANFPHIRMEKKGKQICYIGIRSVGATVAEGETFPPEFLNKIPWLFFAEITSVAVSFIPTITIIIALVCCDFFSCSNLLLLCMFRRCLMRGRLMTAEAIKTFSSFRCAKMTKKF